MARERHHLRRAGAVLLTVALAVVGVTACSKESAAARAERLVLGAAEATFGEGTAQVLISLVGFGDGEGEAQVDFENAQSQASIDLPAGPTSVFLDGDSLLVQLQDVVTLVDPDQLDALGQLRALLVLLSPAQAVQLLNGLTGDIEIVGDDSVDSVDTTHYALQVDVDAILDALDGDARRAMQTALDALGTDTLDIDVWIDDDGRVIQFQAAVDAGDGDPVTVTLNYSDFGSDVTIDIPSPSDVVDAREFGLSTADITGHWTGSNLVIDTTDGGWYAVGPLAEFEADFQCGPNGRCTNTVTDSRWVPAGGGSYTVVTNVTGDCTDTVTGAVTTPGGYNEVANTTWTVTAYEDGQATEITETGTIVGTVNAAGRAEDCIFPGGGFEGRATVEGILRRT